jgi:16S rRNA (cytosine1402-N4)-methyltransferase
MSEYHLSVLLQETIEALEIEPGKKYIDGTIGGGGHTAEILKRGGIVLGIDQDDQALDFVKAHCEEQMANGSLILAKGNFKDIDVIAKEHNFDQVDGILLDIGISSHHVDEAERGFSFQKEGPLDMRMDRDQQVKAGDLINILTKGELYDLFTKLGEERFAHSIAGRIVSARQIKRIETTTELAEIVRRSVPYSKKGFNPATRVFQALRIAVNDELNVLTESLPKSVQLLSSSGRLAVISFHSLEDRIVKRTFLALAEEGLGKIITKKPIIPTEEENAINGRARSSKLRVFEKI